MVVLPSLLCSVGPSSDLFATPKGAADPRPRKRRRRRRALEGIGENAKEHHFVGMDSGGELRRRGREGRWSGRRRRGEDVDEGHFVNARQTRATATTTTTALPRQRFRRPLALVAALLASAPSRSFAAPPTRFRRDLGEWASGSGGVEPDEDVSDSPSPSPPPAPPDPDPGVPGETTDAHAYPTRTVADYYVFVDGQWVTTDSWDLYGRSGTDPTGRLAISASPTATSSSSPSTASSLTPPSSTSPASASDSTMSSSSTSSSTSGPTLPSGWDYTSSRGKFYPVPLIVGLSIGLALLVVAILLGCVSLKRSQKRKRRAKRNVEEAAVEGDGAGERQGGVGDGAEEMVEKAREKKGLKAKVRGMKIMRRKVVAVGSTEVVASSRGAGGDGSSPLRRRKNRGRRRGAEGLERQDTDDSRTALTTSAEEPAGSPSRARATRRSRIDNGAGVSGAVPVGQRLREIVGSSGDSNSTGPSASATTSGLSGIVSSANEPLTADALARADRESADDATPASPEVNDHDAAEATLDELGPVPAYAASRSGTGGGQRTSTLGESGRGLPVDEKASPPIDDESLPSLPPPPLPGWEPPTHAGSSTGERGEAPPAQGGWSGHVATDDKAVLQRLATMASAPPEGGRPSAPPPTPGGSSANVDVASAPPMVVDGEGFELPDGDDRTSLHEEPRAASSLPAPPRAVETNFNPARLAQSSSSADASAPPQGGPTMSQQAASKAAEAEWEAAVQPSAPLPVYDSRHQAGSAEGPSAPPLYPEEEGEDDAEGAEPEGRMEHREV